MEVCLPLLAVACSPGGYRLGFLFPFPGLWLPQSLRHPAVVKLGAPPILLSPCFHAEPIMWGITFSDLLEARVATAYTLRDFDENARRMKVRRLRGRAASDRQLLADGLKFYGGEPWEYNPDEDNSWLPHA